MSDDNISDDNILDFSALQKWNKIPNRVREQLLENVFCGNCGVTQIQPGFVIKELTHGEIRILGQCVKCGKNVYRVVQGE